jgi:hypothetical protein
VQDFLTRRLNVNVYLESFNSRVAEGSKKSIEEIILMCRRTMRIVRRLDLITQRVNPKDNDFDSNTLESLKRLMDAWMDLDAQGGCKTWQAEMLHKVIVSSLVLESIIINKANEFSVYCSSFMTTKNETEESIKINPYVVVKAELDRFDRIEQVNELCYFLENEKP